MLSLGTGTSVRHYEGRNDTAKVFRVWPRTSTGDIDVFYRTKPDTFTGDIEVDFDDQVLILGAAWDYLEDDGTNPGASEKMERMYLERSRQIGNNIDRSPISLDHNAGRPASFEFTAL